MSITDLPPLDDITREDLIEMVKVLHAGLVRTQALYDSLAHAVFVATERAE